MFRRKLMGMMMAVTLAATAVTGCGNATGGSSGKASDTKIVIYSNADDEAITAMKNALDNNGYKDKYTFNGFGTSELGGKLLAEGKNIEADMVTMSTFYLDSAQQQNKMFQKLDFPIKTLDKFGDYAAPITSQEGAIIMNTDLMKKYNLSTPTGLKDLTKKEYKGYLAITDVKSSSTAWLLMQALISAYGEKEAQNVLKQIYVNAGDHIEDSGSAPLKLCRAGEVAIGFGLRHQAVADKANGQPIDYVDPTEGNFSLTESVAVIDKGKDTNPQAQKMAQCIIEHGREELQKSYPNPLYEGESADAANKSTYPKTFSEPLTFELYEKHQQLSDEVMP